MIEHGADAVKDLTPPLDEAALAERFRIEHARLHMRRERLTAASGALPSAYLAWLLSPYTAHGPLLMWWLALLAVDLAGVLHATAYLRLTTPPPDSGRWLGRQTALQTLAGVIWGFSCVWAFDSVNSTLSVAIVLVAVSAVGAIGLMLYRRAVLLNSLSIMGPPTVLLLLYGDSFQLNLVAGVVVLLVSFNFYVWEASSQLAAGLEERLRADALARALRDAFTQIHALATRDDLTGCLNRREGMQRLAQTLQPERRDPVTPACLILLDVDHFKRINDTRGHPGGDTVLRAVTQAAQQALRDGDLLARIGGEEFMVIARGQAQTGLRLAERLRAVVAATPVPLGVGEPVRVTISLGVTVLLPNESVESVLQRADDALYKAKNGGRNQVVAAEANLVPAVPD